MPEEVACLIISYAMELKESGVLTDQDDLWPIRVLEKYSGASTMQGVGKGGGDMSTKYAVVLRAEFVGIGSESGALENKFVDTYFKILPKGTSTVAGCILGFPLLDRAPHGLGHEVHDVGHYFRGKGSEMDVHLPRIELAERAESKVAIAIWKEGPFYDGDALDSVQLLVDAARKLAGPCAYFDAPELLLGAGEEAIVPATWSGQVPTKDFMVVPVTERNHALCVGFSSGRPLEVAAESLDVAEGICAGGHRSTMLCLKNCSDEPIILAPGQVLGLGEPFKRGVASSADIGATPRGV